MVLIASQEEIEMNESASSDLLTMTADITSAYVSNNSVPAAELAALLVQVHGALTRLSAAPAASEPEAEKATSVQIKKSITPDGLISFIDGKPYKTLRRHLTTHGLTIEEYRSRYGLPNDYPTVSANYSAARSALAKELGLGNQRRKAAAPKPATKPKRPGRARKATEPA